MSTFIHPPLGYGDLDYALITRYWEWELELALLCQDQHQHLGVFGWPEHNVEMLRAIGPEPHETLSKLNAAISAVGPNLLYVRVENGLARVTSELTPFPGWVDQVRTARLQANARCFVMLPDYFPFKRQSKRAQPFEWVIFPRLENYPYHAVAFANNLVLGKRNIVVNEVALGVWERLKQDIRGRNVRKDG